MIGLLIYNCGVSKYECNATKVKYMYFVLCTESCPFKFWNFVIDFLGPNSLVRSRMKLLSYVLAMVDTSSENYFVWIDVKKRGKEKKKKKTNCLFIYVQRKCTNCYDMINEKFSILMTTIFSVQTTKAD